MAKRKLRERRRSLLHEDDLDPIWSRKTKELAGNKCEYCGSTENLNSHHIFGRTNRSVRWDLQNCCVLCAKHHEFSTIFSAHGTPLLFSDWLQRERPYNWYTELTAKAMKTVKVTQEFYREKLEELNS